MICALIPQTSNLTSDLERLTCDSRRLNVVVWFSASSGDDSEEYVGETEDPGRVLKDGGSVNDGTLGSDDGLGEEGDSQSESGSPDETVPLTVKEEEYASSLASSSGRSESEEAENINKLRKSRHSYSHIYK